MKVLWFTSTSLVGDERSKIYSGSWITSLESEIKSRNIELAIAYSTNSNISSPFQDTGCRYYPIPKKKIKKKSIFGKYRKRNPNSNVKHYLDIVNDYQPQIIQVFGTEDDFGLICEYTDIPVVIHIQGFFTSCYMKKNAWISSSMQFKKNKNLYPKQFSFLTYILVLLKAIKEKLNESNEIAKIIHEERIYNSCKFFIGRTHWDNNIVSNFSKIGKYYHCDEILRSGFYNAKWKRVNPSKSINIISVLGPSPYKGFETILETSIWLKKLNKKFVWKIIGVKESDGIIQKVESYYSTKFSKNSVYLMGRKKEGDLVREILASDLFVHPSHIENSSNSICEAMLMGIPIIAANTGGTSSLINHNIDGVLIPDADPYSLVSSIIYLSNNFKIAKELGKNASSVAITRHNPDLIVDRLLSIYHDILNIK